jgi:hypothetical protein
VGTRYRPEQGELEVKTIQVSEETYEAIREKLQEEERVDVSSVEDMVGQCFFFRTVTYHLLGRVVGCMGTFLQLEDASWISDSGRFMQAIKEGTLSEIEPVGTRHDLPGEQK